MDIKHPFYQEFETNKADWAVDSWLHTSDVRWIQRLGVRSQHLTSHPRADDVVTLLNIRQSLWDVMSQPERNCWGAYWGLVFVNHYPLNEKFWRKFQNIANQIDIRQQKRQIRQQQVRQRLRTLKNTDHDNEAKGSNLAQMLTNKSNNRGATMISHQ